MYRHAAHRDIRALVLAALGQRYIECCGGLLGVAEEHFVEIAHPIEQQIIRVSLFDFQILCHHRRGRIAPRLHLRRSGHCIGCPAGNPLIV